MHLLLLCCQPGLSVRYKIIITLHLVSGFGVPEIANALFMKEEAVKKAITRIKATLRASGLTMPGVLKKQLVQHRHVIHTILYLLFNEGYKTTRRQGGINIDLCYEATRLLQLIAMEDPCHDAHALLSLMFLNVSRFPARISARDEWLTLAQQDRRLWNRALIGTGLFYLDKAGMENFPGQFYIEALISSIHCTTERFEDTDWTKIAALYGQLEKMLPGDPVITLNRIIAESYTGTVVGLAEELSGLEPLFTAGYGLLYWLTKAHLYQQEGEMSLVPGCYKEALAAARSQIDREFVQKKISEFTRSQQ
ncbi:hypothetical protein UNH65_16075 [Chitinophaga sp. 180180018-2]|nr:hypothetical protein [Chitinophaga sp. 212800010-3]